VAKKFSPPLFKKEGSVFLYEREVRRDFMKSNK
jgi:hypothetical protein